MSRSLDRSPVRGPRPAVAPAAAPGWLVLAAAVVTQMMTGPGQSVGVSVFIDPLIADLDLSRSLVSTAYLVGTLCGAVAMPRAGRLIDRRGVRHATLLFAAGFGAVLIAMSAVNGLIALMVAFSGTRMLGQGALTLTATTSVTVGFGPGRGTALGLLSALGGSAMSLVPLVGAFLISAVGWRSAWVVFGVLVWVVLIPLAMWVMPRGTGRAVGFDEGVDTAQDRSWPVPAVVRHPMFWVLAAAVGLAALNGTALVFHQIELLAQRGLTDVQAAANFLPQTAAGAAGAVVAGRLADRISHRVLVPASMILLAAATVLVLVVHPGITAVGYGVVLGVAGNSIRTIEAALLPSWFGTSSIGELRGVVMATAVACSAVGPVLLSVGRDVVGSYGPVLWALAVGPLLVGIAAACIPPPGPLTSVER